MIILFSMRFLDIEVFPEIGDLSLEEQKFPTKPGIVFYCDFYSRRKLNLNRDFKAHDA